MTNHPTHYQGPVITFPSAPGFQLSLECIDVIRHIQDMRLANAIKYIWRVAFGGKHDNRKNIQKACWYLQDWLDNPAGDP